MPINNGVPLPSDLLNRKIILVNYFAVAAEES